MNNKRITLDYSEYKDLLQKEHENRIKISICLAELKKGNFAIYEYDVFNNRHTYHLYGDIREFVKEIPLKELLKIKCGI